MVISHTCTRCGHPDIWRLGGRSRTQCGASSCSCGKCTPGPPQLRPTFDQAGRVVERIVKPGEALHPGVPTCGCAQCKELYERLTAA